MCGEASGWYWQLAIGNYHSHSVLSNSFCIGSRSSGSSSEQQSQMLPPNPLLEDVASSFLFSLLFSSHYPPTTIHFLQNPIML